MGKKMSDTSPEDMDRLVGESLLFYSQDNESIELSLTFTQTAVIQDVLGIKERDEKVCMYDDGHLEKVLGDADYLHKVRLGVGSDDSPFGVFSKSECVFLLEGALATHSVVRCPGVRIGQDAGLEDGRKIRGRNVGRRTVVGLSARQVVRCPTRALGNQKETGSRKAKNVRYLVYKWSCNLHQATPL